jgi:glycerol-3-phosphate dehydrogenase subunit B
VSHRVLVIGAGVAGLAAAWSAHRGGADVTIVEGRAGASALGVGAVDDLPWERVVRAAHTLGVAPFARSLTPEVMDFARDLALWDLPAEALAWIATTAGRLRPARGRDLALLDFNALAPGAEVLLPRVDRAAWDADALAAGLGDEPFARARRLRFVAVDAPLLRFEGETRIADGDLAARHDEPARLAWLAERLREARRRRPAASAVLLGPWLGARASRAAALGEAIGVTVGEALIATGSPAGLRFEAARDRLLRALGSRVVQGRVTAIDDDGNELSVQLAGEGEPILVDRAVLAVGGLIGGGIGYAPPEHEAGADLPPAAQEPFALSLRAKVALCAPASSLRASSRLGVVSSMHGPEIELAAWPSEGRDGVLESVGVYCEGVRAGLRITAAGDVVAGRPRTVLEAVVTGLAAGHALRPHGAAAGSE